MSGEWPAVPLGELIAPGRTISYGIVQPGQPDPRGVPIVRVGDVRNGRIDAGTPLKVSSGIEQRYSRTRLRGGELLITIVGTVGETAIVPPALAGWNIARAVAILPIREDIGAYWIKLALRSPAADAALRSRLNTTVQATLNLKDLAMLPISVPPLSVRQGIISLVGALDDKIDLNRRMNETLEAMARALFRDWFVDFGPTRAKMEGRAPYLAPDLWTLFPDRLDDEGKPEGWDRSAVGDQFLLLMGQSPPGDTYNATGDGMAFFQGRTDFGDRYPRRRVYCTAPTRIAEVDDTLVSVRAPVGDLNMAWERCAIGRGIGAIRHKDGHRGYTYYTLQHLRSALLVYEHEGTVFGAINKAQFAALEIIVPSPQLVGAFETAVCGMDDRIRANVAETTTLEATRDLLLPKLMSGEIRVRDAEKALETAL